jgi:hypothetical protein
METDVEFTATTILSVMPGSTQDQQKAAKFSREKVFVELETLRFGCKSGTSQLDQMGGNLRWTT